jgi:hypothetical protein
LEAKYVRGIRVQSVFNPWLNCVLKEGFKIWQVGKPYPAHGQSQPTWHSAAPRGKTGREMTRNDNLSLFSLFFENLS